MTIDAEQVGSPSFLEWLAIGALGLALAFVIGLAQPEVSRPAPDVPTFMALALTVLACALRAAALVDRGLRSRPGWLRGPSALLALVAVVAAGGWLIARAPGRELLVAWVVAPPAIGIAAVAVAGRAGSWAAVVFLAVAGILSAVLGFTWL